MPKKWTALFIITALLTALCGCAAPEAAPSVQPSSAPSLLPAATATPDEYWEIPVNTLAGADPAFPDSLPAYPAWAPAAPTALATLEAAPATDETQRYRLLGRQTSDALDVFLYDGEQGRATRMGSAQQTSLAWEGELYALQMDGTVRLFDTAFTELATLPLEGAAFADPSAQPEAAETTEEEEEAEEDAQPTATPATTLDAQTLTLTGVHLYSGAYLLAMRDAEHPLELLLLFYTEAGEPAHLLRVPLEEADLQGAVDTNLVQGTLYVTKESNPTSLNAIHLDTLEQTDLSGALSLFFQGNLAQLSFTETESETLVERAVHLRVTPAEGEAYQIDALLDAIYPLTPDDTLTYDPSMNKVVLTQPLQIVEFYLDDQTVGAGANLQSGLPSTDDGMYSIYLSGFSEEGGATLFLRSNHTGQVIELDTLPSPTDAFGYSFLFLDHTLFCPQMNRAYNLDALGEQPPYTVFQGTIGNILGCVYDAESDQFLVALASAPTGVSEVRLQVYDRGGNLTGDIATGLHADYASGAYTFALLDRSMLLLSDVNPDDPAHTDAVVYDWQMQTQHLRKDAGLVWQEGGVLFEMGTDTPGTLELKAYDPGITDLNELFSVRLTDAAQGLGRYNPYAAAYDPETRLLVIPPMPVYETFFQLPPIEQTV